MIKTKSFSSHLIRSTLGVSLLAGVSFGAHAVGIEDVVDGGNNFAWERVEIPGTKCSDGSTYKFWVADNPNSNNLVINYEGGGACWDWESCSGQLGILGAANPNGLDDAYIDQTYVRYVSPIMNGADPGVVLFRDKTNLATNGWDTAFMPYCTGDVHTGNNSVVYEDPAGIQPPILFHHNGYANSTAAMDYLNQRFDNINKVLVTGFSAGGAASNALYHEIRQRIDFNDGYMINDSGPLHPAPDASYNSHEMHQRIKVSWNMDSVLDTMPASFDADDLGTANSALSATYPNDQFAYTGYLTDYNYSRFSYERVDPSLTEAQVLAKWQDDQRNLINQMNSLPNWSYHMPWNRPFNDSHCSTVATFIGSHACPSIRKKRWWERWEWPWGQSWKCPGAFYTMEAFVDAFVAGQIWRVEEPANGYNQEDPGMNLIVDLIDTAGL